MHSATQGKEYQDLGTHRRMWHAFTGFMVKGIVGVIITLLIVGFLTGVL